MGSVCYKDNYFFKINNLVSFKTFFKSQTCPWGHTIMKIRCYTLN